MIRSFQGTSMQIPSSHTSRLLRTYEPVPEQYLAALAGVVRDYAAAGRGDEARGRHLAALYALEWCYRHDLFDYRPTRDPARWLLLLLDVAGARIGLSPEDRIRRTLRTFHADLAGIGLPAVASRTRHALRRGVATTMGIPSALAGPLADRMSAGATLWALGVPPSGPSGREKHPQGREIRKVLRARLDAGWDEALATIDTQRTPNAYDILAAIPFSFDVATRTIEASLERVGESLTSVPFAVFYALLTDARRGGRVWDPPAHYVDGGTFDRAAFDAAVGHALGAARSRKNRFRRSAALAELGLSATFPRTVARIDRWLAQRPIPEFRLDDPAGTYPEPDWYSWSVLEGAHIRQRHTALVATFTTQPPTVR